MVSYDFLERIVLKQKISNLKLVLNSENFIPNRGELIIMLRGLEVEYNSQELERKLQEYATKNSLALNSNKEIKKGILTGLVVSKEKYGEYYCPCKPLREDKSNICPCAEGMKELKEQGSCYCGLFYKKKS